MNVLGLDHVVLAVANLERSIAFYRVVLGARIERQLQSPRIVQLRMLVGRQARQVDVLGPGDPTAVNLAPTGTPAGYR